ncbi:MAG TPA: alkaline phosphatase family protein [Bryobacteraceae bacterium]|nr:alkaline phosphatase family protein [Bryobacteraceae bacterium]
MRLRSIVTTVILALLATAASQANPPFPAKPKLVVLIAIDQFRYDYLTRYERELTGGLHRMLVEGAVFANANLAHYPSVTAVGHSTMLTGATPALSGIVGNQWFDRTTGKAVSSVSDSEVRLLGGSDGEASSPRRLLVSTVGDEMKRVDPGCRVIGISIKDRAAILPSGHRADGAYWLDTSTGTFVSSTYYFPALPLWVKAFTDSHVLDAYEGREWKFFGNVMRMPQQAGGPLAKALYYSPFGNDVVEQFAEHAIDAEKLGQRGTTDLLTVSFSSIDAVGHQTGPDSPKVHDLVLEEDQTVGRMLDHLDKVVGLKDVLLILTADHGVAEMPQNTAAARMPGGRLKDADLLSAAQTALEQKYGPGKWTVAAFDGAIFLNETLMESKYLNAGEVQEVAAGALERIPHVFRVYTRQQLRRGQVPQDKLSRVLSGSFNWTRSADLQVILDPYWVRSSTNTGHDTPFSYDTHIPLIFMGTGIQPGMYYQNVELNDLAPTLSSLLSVQTPSGSVGRALYEILRPVLVPAGTPVSLRR